MTEMEFNFYILFGIFRKVAEACTTWVDQLITSTSAHWFYISCLAIFLFTRLVLRPIIGYSMGAGKSDQAKSSKGKKE